MSLGTISPLNNIKILHNNIKGDIASGITVAVIALPLALAFGEMSGLGPAAGILGAICGGIIGGLFGGCAFSVSGPTAPTAMFISAYAISTTNQPDLVAVFSIITLSGLILIGLSLIRISRFIHYIPYSVVAGFMCGIGIIVIGNYIKTFIGLDSPTATFHVPLIGNIQKEVLYISAPCIIILLFWRTIKTKISLLKNIPAPLVVLIVGTGATYLLNLNIPLMGDKMPETGQNKFLLYLPDFARLNDFIGPALSLAGLIIIDSLLTCIIADNLTGTRHISDQETFGQGLANISCGLIGGAPTATATMFTVTNVKSGGTTPLASAFYGLTLLAILLGLDLTAIPNACIAAILIKVGIDILDYRIIPVLKKLPLTDLVAFAAVLLITVIWDLMLAVGIGVLFTGLRSIKQIKQSIQADYRHRTISISELIKNMDRNAIDNQHIKVLQPRGALFFGNTEQLTNIYDSIPQHKTLIIDLSQITEIDISGSFYLEDLINSSKQKGKNVVVFNNNPQVENKLKKINFVNHVGDLYQTSEEFLNSYIQNLHTKKGS